MVSYQWHGPPAAGGIASLSRRYRTPILVGAVILSALLAFGALVAFGVARNNAIYAEFLDGCERDHKHYECMLLWRATRQSDPTVIPIPIPIPSSR